MCSITSKLNSTFRTIGKPRADKMPAKVVSIISQREELISTRCYAEKLVCEILNIFCFQIIFFFGLIVDQNVLLLNFPSRFLHLVALIWEFDVLKVNSFFTNWISACLIQGDLCSLFVQFTRFVQIYFLEFHSATTEFLVKELSGY